MGKIILFTFGLTLLGGGTTAGYLASVRGWGLPGLVDEPISLRDSSVQTRGRGYNPALLYFATRRHGGGGFGYGK